MNNITTCSIGSLILNKQTPQRSYRVEHYLIPAYQRGYRWIADLHVEALLEDIDNFLTKDRNSDESYCLQPIVVAARTDAEGYRIWEVIDGQQRLTTLCIILRHLHKACFELKFEKRPHSEEYIKRLEDRQYDDSNPDFHFMGAAHRQIVEWFEKKSRDDINYGDRFAMTLLDHVKVIWYEIELKGTTPQEVEEEKINAFNRLNIGKIPLEDAELVRALLMSKLSGQSARELLMRQSEFSNEWYEMEHTLQDKQMWRFLTKKNYSNHIQLIFELMAGNKNSSNYNTYKWFEKEIQKVQGSGEEDAEETDSVQTAKKQEENAHRLWTQAKAIFGKFRYWYTDRTVYHYVGFLLASSQASLEDILQKSEQDKDLFLKELHKDILEYVNETDLSKLDYVNDPESIKRLLLLFNVLTCESLTDTPQNRFPFNLYNDIAEAKKWSLEHIHAQQSEDPLWRDDIIREWIKDTLSSLQKVNAIIKEDGKEEDKTDIEELKKRLEAFPKEGKIDKEAFNKVREDIVRAFESRPTVHQIDNLTLLSCPDNARLSNAIFPVKRDRIIRMEREGHFIPPCTRNVFLKLYSKADNQPYYWSTQDKEDYVTAIFDTFEQFKNKNL